MTKAPHTHHHLSPPPGTSDQRLFVMTMRRISPSYALAILDHHGKVVYANSQLADMLGYEPARMKNMDIQEMLQQPYGCMHHKWYVGGLVEGGGTGEGRGEEEIGRAHV